MRLSIYGHPCGPKSSPFSAAIPSCVAIRSSRKIRKVCLMPPKGRSRSRRTSEAGAKTKFADLPLTENCASVLVLELRESGKSSLRSSAVTIRNSIR